MKRKKTNWDKVAWSPFVQVPLPRDYAPLPIDAPAAVVVNSRYQVTIWYRDGGATFGPIVHLSIKTHDRQARHDWRDFQRIKNEIVGPEFDAVEIYPAESKLVDSANQYHVFVFREFRLPFGFSERLVGDGNWQDSKQRPFAPGERPADCLSPADYQARIDALVATKP